MDGPMTTDALTGPALPLLLRLEADGFELRAEGDRLQVRPPARLTPELLSALRQHKADLLRLVRCLDAGVQARRDVFELQLVQTPTPGVPAFLLKADVPYVKGTCFSCADPLPELRFGRCWRCSLAWRLACRLPVSADLAAAVDSARVA